MLALEFPGSTRLVDSLTAAVCHDCPTEITDALRTTLCELIRDPEVKLPDCCYERAPLRPPRVVSQRQHGFSVIAMTWGPGQGTPIHDHAGMWCVEVCGTARSRSRRTN
jgi:predicted metal-dependent enzyme (double-stranded beta helix superfamily)